MAIRRRGALRNPQHLYWPVLERVKRGHWGLSIENKRVFHYLRDAETSPFNKEKLGTIEMVLVSFGGNFTENLTRTANYKPLGVEKPRMAIVVEWAARNVGPDWIRSGRCSYRNTCLLPLRFTCDQPLECTGGMRLRKITAHFHILSLKCVSI